MCNQPTFQATLSLPKVLVRIKHHVLAQLVLLLATMAGSSLSAMQLPFEEPLKLPDDVPSSAEEQLPAAERDPEARDPEARLPEPERGIELSLRSAAANWPIVTNDKPLQLTVQFRGLPSGLQSRLTAQCQLVRISDHQVMMEHRQQVTRSVDGSTSAIELTVSDLGQPGVYQWNVSLSQQQKAWSGLVRSEKTIAQHKVSMAVYAPTTTGDTEPFAATERLRWQSSGDASPIDPLTRVTPDWIPESATRFVPDITQVGDALTIPTFGPASSKTASAAPSLGTYGAATPCLLTLPRYRAHELTKLQLNVQSTDRTTDPIRLKLEYSASPNFQAITRTVPVTLWPQLDLQAVPPLGTSALEVLHYPRHAQEYLRVTNLDSDNTVTIDSVQVFTANEEQQATEANAASNLATNRPEASGRRLHWHCRDQDWIKQLTPDLEPETLGKHGDSEETQQLYRAWIALQRLESHAAWIGYQSVSVPLFETKAAELKDSDTASNESTNAEGGSLNPPRQGTQQLSSEEVAAGRADAPNLSAAVQQWAQSLPLRITLRHETTSDASVTGSNSHPRRLDSALAQRPSLDGVSIAFAGNDDLTLVTDVSASGIEQHTTMAHRLLTLLIQSNPHLTQLDAATLPMACQSTTREALQQFRLTPENSIVIPAAATPAQPASRHNVVLLASGELAADFQLRKGVNQLTLINRNPWATDITLQVQHEQSLAINLVSLHPEIAAQRVGAPADFRVRVPGNSIVNVKLDCPPRPAQISEWSQSIADQPTASNAIELYVRQVTHLLTSLQSPASEIPFTNGSFEQTGQAGMVGWLHSQVPNGAVQVDPQEAIDGRASLRMSNDSDQTKCWLMSGPITRPAGQRLAISMAFRSALQGSLPNSNAAARAQQLRITLEGESDGQIISISNRITVPQTGTWHRRQVVLEAMAHQLAHVESVRLTIECLGKGDLWLDDIRVHTEFATTAEQAELKQLAFSALQGLSEQDLEATGPLFANRWALRLLSDSLRSAPSRNVARRDWPSQEATHSLALPTLRPRAEQSPWGNTRDIPNAEAAEGAGLSILPNLESIGPKRILPFYHGFSLPGNLPLSPNAAFLDDSEATTTPKSVTDSEPQKAKQPGVADRIRDLTPKPFRY
ncbi:MAG: hypothetical protein CBB71_17835 [Rhodopirellula sp. TMED11]|nr:MAG: hypothetical protein CBB71_17835 [Rhodopirellula sp. TMED11]